MKIYLIHNSGCIMFNPNDQRNWASHLLGLFGSLVNHLNFTTGMILAAVPRPLFLAQLSRGADKNPFSDFVGFVHRGNHPGGFRFQGID